MGPQLVAKSIYLIWRNLGAALRATVIPLGLATALAVAVMGPAFVIYGEQVELSTRDGDEVPATLIGQMLLAAIVYIIGSFWAAVAWHRFVLLEEEPGWLPRPPAARIGAYAWGFARLLVPFLIVLVIASVVAGAIAGVVAALDSPVLAGLLVFGLYVLVSYAMLRFSLILPAAAVGDRLGAFESWRRTSPARAAVLTAAALLVVLQGVLQVGGAALGLAGLPGAVLSLLVSWFSLVLSLSIFTTLYGVLIEDRPVD